MKKKNSYFIFWIFFIFLAIACDQKSDNAPNVILIMTDDQCYGDIAAHGNLFIRTPELDRLHDESICFTDFQVNSFCSPTRLTLMTGRMLDRTPAH